MVRQFEEISGVEFGLKLLGKERGGFCPIGLVPTVWISGLEAVKRMQTKRRQTVRWLIGTGSSEALAISAAEAIAQVPRCARL